MPAKIVLFTKEGDVVGVIGFVTRVSIDLGDGYIMELTSDQLAHIDVRFGEINDRIAKVEEAIAKEKAFIAEAQLLSSNPEIAARIRVAEEQLAAYEVMLKHLQDLNVER